MDNVFIEKSKENTFRQHWQKSRAMRLVVCVSAVLILFGPELHKVWDEYTFEVKMVPLSGGQTVPTPILHCTYN